ncbi:MAG: response regulator [Elusimicrobia bacterium]|nr:response regulator [Elusimicrobiota bacterium]
MTETPQHPSAKTVLIVEDDRGVMELLKIVLEREGFRMSEAIDGEEALQKARGTPNPDLILLDLMLPKSGGFEVVRELQDENTGNIPVVIMTGRAMDRSTSEMILHEPNVREYLEKPIKPAALCALLHKLLNTRPSAR